MEFVNYVEESKRSLWYKHFCYADVREYLADALFEKYNIHVRYEGEYQKAGCDYVFIFCKVPKKEADKFEMALDELKRKMLLLGYPEYPEICELFAA